MQSLEDRLVRTDWAVEFVQKQRRLETAVLLSHSA